MGTSSTQLILLLNVPFFYCIHEYPHDYLRYTRYILEKYVEDVDLELIEVKSFGGVIEIVTDIFVRHINQIPLVGSFISHLILFISFFVRKSYFGKKITRRTNINYPYGYSLIAKKKTVFLN